MSDLSESDNSTSKARLRLWLKMLGVSRHIEAELKSNLRAEFKSTLPKFDVMAALDRFKDGLKMKDLSAVLRVSNGNVTGIIDRLVDDGLVERLSIVGDRRAFLVRLTKPGSQEFAKQAVAHEAWVNQLFGLFDTTEAEELIQQMNGVVNTSDSRLDEDKKDK